jgi:hypothetical protein
MFNTGNNMAQLFSDPFLGSGLDQTLHGLQRADLCPPTLGIIQDLLQQIDNLPRSFRGGNLDDGVNTGLSGLSDRLSLVHDDVQEDGNGSEEETLGTFTESLDQSFHQDPGALPLR